MKRFQLFLVGAFVAAGPLFAQSADADWHSEVAKVKELIQTNPAQASEEAAQLLKGKNKKNTDLLIAIGQAYLEAGKINEAEAYAALGQKANSKSAAVSVLQGDIAVAKKDAGKACQLYEQAIYFDPNYKEAYLKFADVYKGASPQLAIEKLEQLKNLDPSCVAADKKLAEVYYLNNKFDKAAEAYAHFINTPEATEDDLTKYSFALFLNHDFEKSLQIGGQLLIASVPPRKEEMMRSINYYTNVLPELDVTFRLGQEFTSQDYNSFDEVIVATGANNAIIPVPGKDLPTVASAWDVLAKKEIVFGNVSVIGGGLVGVETAEYLASRGCKVTIIEMMDQIAKEESNTILPTLMRELEHYNVQIVTSAKLSEIKDDSVVVEKTIDDNTSTEEIASDFVVMAVGARKNLPELSDCPLPLHYIGDCAGERPSNIDHAIKSAYDVACEI